MEEELIFSKKEILSKKQSVNFMSSCCIYFLIRNEEIIYVGSSDEAAYSRISYHSKDKKFDSFVLLPCKNQIGIKKKESI